MPRIANAPAFSLASLATLFAFCLSNIGVCASLDHRLLPMPEALRHKVSFWEKVFYHYPSDSVLIHDTDQNQAIVDILDFKLLSKRQGKRLDRKTRRKLTKSYLARYELALSRFHKLKEKALRFGPIEKRIYSVFSRNQKSLTRLYTNQISLRSQAGLADEFLIASDRAKYYLPYMEKVFVAKGLPPVLTRLAFVESMFNTKAKSKVGASGVWQFMPDTGRQYLIINHLVDERNTPFKAAHAAASLLSDNYQELRSWPLAITAYNHGKAGIMRAVKASNSSDLATIIDTYEGPNFQFASRNFYAEFLAAARTYERLIKEKKATSISIHDPIVAMTLDEPLSMSEFLSRTQLSPNTLANYNRGLSKRTFAEYRHHKLPKAFTVFLPSSIAKKVENRLIRKKETYAKKN